jgi:hypothetical protein
MSILLEGIQRDGRVGLKTIIVIIGKCLASCGQLRCLVAPWSPWRTGGPHECIIEVLGFDDVIIVATSSQTPILRNDSFLLLCHSYIRWSSGSLANDLPSDDRDHARAAPFGYGFVVHTASTSRSILEHPYLNKI